MNINNFQKIAEDYSTRARNRDRVSNDFRKAHPGDTPTYGDVSHGYELAGDKWVEAENYGQAEKQYRKAYKHAFDKKIKIKIKDKISNLNSLKKRGIEKYFFFGMGCFVFALVFSSFSLTGAVTGQFLSQSNSTFIGTGFFLLGLIFTFVSFKKKK